MHFRTIFISDVHLGSKACNAEAALDFLKTHSCDALYIVGDFIDLWALRRKVFLPQSHVNVIQRVLKIAKQGTKVVYCPGNHDEYVREFIPVTLGNITIVDDAIFETVDGRRFLVIHGDAFDQVVRHARWLAWLGDIGYHLLMSSNSLVNGVRRRLGLPRWSLSAYVKSRVKQAVSFVGNFERAVVRSVEEKGLDGVICGHIHTANIARFGGVLYLNDGDFCESCTALVERDNGELVLMALGGDGFQPTMKLMSDGNIVGA